MSSKKHNRKVQSQIAPGHNGVHRAVVLPPAHPMTSDESEHASDNEDHSTNASGDETQPPETVMDNTSEEAFRVKLLWLLRAKYRPNEMNHRYNPDFFPLCFDQRAYPKVRPGANTKEIEDNAHGKKLKNYCSKLILAVTKMSELNIYKHMENARLNSIPEYDNLGKLKISFKMSRINLILLFNYVRHCNCSNGS
jgi:hypothetical protein